MPDPSGSTTFIGIYRGATISSARLVAVSADPAIVAEVTRRLLAGVDPSPTDPVLSKLDTGRRSALRAIRREAQDAHPV
jgi:hypothetical protein